MAHGPGAHAVALGERAEHVGAVGGDLAQHGVHETLGVRVPAGHEAHSVVHDRIDGHAVEEEQLEGRDAKRLEDRPPRLCQRRLGEGAEDGVDRSAALDGADDEFVGQAAVARVEALELRAAPRPSRRNGRPRRADAREHARRRGEPG